MDNKIGMVSAIINVCAVIAFALCMPFGFSFGNYLTSALISFSFVPMICAFAAVGNERTKAAGNTAMLFAGMYAVIILLVYFAQLTTVRLEAINEQATALIDYRLFGLFFNYDLLGYCLMALSTFFAGMTIISKEKNNVALKRLLMIHGAFAISCFFMPMLGIFSSDMQGAEWVGTAILEFWCLYFIPVGILSFFHFKKMEGVEIGND